MGQMPLHHLTNSIKTLKEMPISKSGTKSIFSKRHISNYQRTDYDQNTSSTQHEVMLILVSYDSFLV